MEKQQRAEVIAATERKIKKLSSEIRSAKKAKKLDQAKSLEQRLQVAKERLKVLQATE